jgi:hypothetical protein
MCESIWSWLCTALALTLASTPLLLVLPLIDPLERGQFTRFYPIRHSVVVLIITRSRVPPTGTTESTRTIRTTRPLAGLSSTQPSMPSSTKTSSRRWSRRKCRSGSSSRGWTQSRATRLRPTHFRRQPTTTNQHKARPRRLVVRRVQPLGRGGCVLGVTRPPARLMVGATRPCASNSTRSRAGSAKSTTSEGLAHSTTESDRNDKHVVSNMYFEVVI